LKEGYVISGDFTGLGSSRKPLF